MGVQLKLPEVARRLGVSEKTARRYVKSGALPSMFVGNAYRVSEEDVEKFLQESKVTAGGDLGKAPSSSLEPSFNDALRDERSEAIYDMVLAAARRQAKQDRQATARALESGRAQAYFMRHENEVVASLLEHSPDELAGTLIEMARRCVQLEDELRQRTEAAASEEVSRRAPA